MCIRVLTIFKCACPHRNTLVCPHHVHVREPSSSSSSTSSTATSSDLSSSPSRPTTASSEASPETTTNNTTSNDTTNTTNPDEDSSSDFQKGFHPRLPSALQGHKSWTPLPGKENQRWEHCPGYLAKSRALAVASAGSKTGEVLVGKETQCAEYKATEPKFRRRWEVKTGLCGECRGVHGMDGPGVVMSGVGDVKGDVNALGEKEKVRVRVRVNGVLGKGSEAERDRGRARSRAVTDPTIGAMPVPASVDVGGNMVKGASGKVLGKRVVRKRIATL